MPLSIVYKSALCSPKDRVISTISLPLMKSVTSSFNLPASLWLINRFISVFKLINDPSTLTNIELLTSSTVNSFNVLILKAFILIKLPEEIELIKSLILFWMNSFSVWPCPANCKNSIKVLAISLIVPISIKKDKVSALPWVV